ncbi:hypothetical protein BH10PSE15_BH10PSE15_05950 [soil metagenome]
MKHLDLGHKVAPPRFIAFAVVFVVGLAALIPMLGWSRGAMAAFDAASLVFLLLAATLLRHGEAAQMRKATRANDANRVGLLVITGITMLIILVAVVKEMRGKSDPWIIALVIVTLALAWLFSNTVYALHYAHLYYSEDEGDDAGGLDIPKCDEPDYWDFIYFSFTLGMTFQTSDVEITSRRLRRVARGQCLAAFVFNLGVLAFTINTLGSAGN